VIWSWPLGATASLFRGAMCFLQAVFSRARAHREEKADESGNSPLGKKEPRSRITSYRIGRTSATAGGFPSRASSWQPSLSHCGLLGLFQPAANAQQTEA
jgi:hypothetical protein